uniref:Uncharacterized protein n=1 Tax=Setaria italica TaxID=4555 RepID=K3ZZL7_SETIT
MLRLRNLLLPLLRASPQIPSPIHHGDCRLLLSTSAAPFSLEDYLPKASKLSARAFNELSSAHHHPRFDPDAVLVLLSSIGLSRANIADVVAVDPLLLRCKVDRLEPRLLALRDRVGLSVPQIASFLAVGSRAVRSCRDVGSKIQFFVNFYGSFEKLLLVIKKNSSLNHLTSDLGRVCGMSDHDIAHLCSRSVRILSFTLEHLEEVVLRVEELGLTRSSAMFKRAVEALAQTTKEKYTARIEFLKNSLGCTESEVATALSKMPRILEISEQNLLRKIQFLVNEVGLEPQYILERLVLFTYSLEKRLVPRHHVIKVLLSKGLLNNNFSFYTIAKMERRLSI